MKRDELERTIARRRQRLHRQVAGRLLPLWKFKHTHPRDACFHRDREYIEAAARRRATRQAGPVDA